MDISPDEVSFELGTEKAASPTPSVSLLQVYPWMNLYLHAQPAKNSPKITQVKRKALLTVIDDPAKAREKIGQKGQWLYVESPSGDRGWVPAWVLSIK